MTFETAYAMLPDWLKNEDDLAALDALFDKVAAHSHHDNLEVFCAFSKLAFYLCDGGGDGGIGGRWPSEVPHALR